MRHQPYRTASSPERRHAHPPDVIEHRTAVPIAEVRHVQARPRCTTFGRAGNLARHPTLGVPAPDMPWCAS